MKKVTKLQNKRLPKKQKDVIDIDPKSLEGNLIAKIIMNRNSGLNTVDRAVNPENYPYRANSDGSISTHLMSYFHDGPKSQAYIEPTLFYSEEGAPALTNIPNTGEEIMAVPNNLAEYISSVGYKKAAEDLKQTLNKDKKQDFIEILSTNTGVKKLQNSGLINKTGYTPGTPSFGNPLNIIPSNNITMEKTPMDIMAISDSGEARIMKPGEKHKFTGANVMEIPVHSFLYNEDPQSLKLKETYFNLMYGENPKKLSTNAAVSGGGDVKASYDNGLVTVTGQRLQPNIIQEDNTIKNAITSNIIGKLFSKDGFGVKPSQKSNKLLETFLNSGLEYNQWKNKLKGANKKAWSNSNYDNIFNIELDDVDTGVKKLEDGGPIIPPGMKPNPLYQDSLNVHNFLKERSLKSAQKAERDYNNSSPFFVGEVPVLSAKDTQLEELRQKFANSVARLEKYNGKPIEISSLSPLFDKMVRFGYMDTPSRYIVSNSSFPMPTTPFIPNTKSIKKASAKAKDSIIDKAITNVENKVAEENKIVIPQHSKIVNGQRIPITEKEANEILSKGKVISIPGQTIKEEDRKNVIIKPLLLQKGGYIKNSTLNNFVKKFQDNGYVYDDALGGVAGGDPMTMGIKMAADKINKKKDQILGGISTAGTMIYGLGNMPDQYSDEKMSKLGMGLQGASVGAKIGGIPGALVGGGLGAAFGWFNAKKNNIEKEEQDYMREMAYIRNSVVGQDKGIPMAKKGGKVKDKFQNTETYFSQLIRDKNKYIIPQMFGSLGDPESGTPIVHIQTEKGESAVMADGGIVDVKAKVLHDFMHKNKVTDVFPEGTFVASSRKNNSLKKDKAEKIVLGHTPVVYDEFENEGEPKEVKMSDIFVKKEQTPAELAKIIAKKFKTVNKLNDVYSMVTNEENKIGRLPYLMKLIEMTEKKKGVKETEEEESMEAPLQERNGGYVKKFQDSGTTELESLYKNYSDKLGDFNNKYQQEYADYFKYARAANAGANLLGAVGTGLQSSAFTPAFKTNRYADQMFSKVPQYLRESAINQAQKPINTIARNLGVLNTPTSTLMGSLGNMTGRAIDSANNINRAYTMDDINQDRNRGRFLQDTENYNIAQQANADNFTRRQDNQKISQGFGYGARALTTDASLRGSQLGTQMQLDRAGIEGPFSAAAQMAQLKMMDNLMKGNSQSNGQTDVKALLDGIGGSKQSAAKNNNQPNSKYDNWLSRYRRTWNEDPNIGNFNEWVAKLPKFIP